MKKLFLIPFLMLSLFMPAQIKEFKAGAHIGIPVGGSSDYSNFNLGLHATYLFWQPLYNLNVGVTTGYSHFFAKSEEYVYNGVKRKYSRDDYGYIPLAATAEYSLGDLIYVGADLGFTISTESGLDSGLFLKPMVGINQEQFQAFLYYNMAEKGFSVIGIGASYKFL